MRNCASGNLEIPGSMRSLSSGRALRGPVGIARGTPVRIALREKANPFAHKRERSS